MAEPFVLINSFEVPSEADDEFVRGWEATRDYLRTQPGYLRTALHRAVSDEAEFRFVNVAEWESSQQFREAVESEGFRRLAAGLQPFVSHPGLYRVVRT